jgi:hypothetical protein
LNSGKGWESEMTGKDLGDSLSRLPLVGSWGTLGGQCQYAPQLSHPKGDGAGVLILSSMLHSGWLPI